MLDTRLGLNVNVDKRGDKTFVTLAGTLDLATVDILSDALGSISPGDQAGVVVDIGELAFLGACGITAISLAAGRFAKICCPLLIVGADRHMRQSLRAIGLNSLLVWPNDAPTSPLSIDAA
jgi:anti-anti-sigma factor